MITTITTPIAMTIIIMTTKDIILIIIKIIIIIIIIIIDTHQIIEIKIITEEGGIIKEMEKKQKK